MATTIRKVIRGVPYHCTKRRFKTALEAGRQMFALELMGNPKQDGLVAPRVYYCEACSAWHWGHPKKKDLKQ